MPKRRRRSENEKEPKAGRTKEHEKFRTLKKLRGAGVTPLLVAQTTTRDRYYQGLRDFSPEASVISATCAPFSPTQEFLVSG